MKEYYSIKVTSYLTTRRMTCYIVHNNSSTPYQGQYTSWLQVCFRKSEWYRSIEQSSTKGLPLSWYDVIIPELGLVIPKVTSRGKSKLSLGCNVKINSTMEIIITVNNNDTVVPTNITSTITTSWKIVRSGVSLDVERLSRQFLRSKVLHQIRHKF